MKKYIFVFVVFPFFVFGQSEGKVWTEIGVKGSVSKNIGWGLAITNRFGSDGLETIFPQATIKYKVTDWFRPSIDYRAVMKLDEYGNYGFSNRLNLNTEFKHAVSNFTGSLRLRYQYSFDNTPSIKYDAEFDQAIRFKPQINYDINDCIFTPSISVEYFYNPNFGPQGRIFTKYRAYIGFDLDVNSPHGFSMGYILDRGMNIASNKTKHIFNLSYDYDLGFKKKKKKKKK
jgi:hypothetical protein